MRITCSCCCAGDAGDAVVLCCADDAVFCLKCDRKIHASKATSNHQRVLLSFISPPARRPKCDGCQEKIGIFFCSEHRTLVCRDCDLSLHAPNSPAATHGRFLVTGARIGEVGVPNSAPVNRGTSSSQSTVCSSISPTGYQYHRDYKGKRGKTASNKSAGNKRILGWDRSSSPIPTNSYPVNQYLPVPNKRCAGMNSLGPQWTGTSSPIPTNPNPDHVNQSSSPMPSMSLVLKPKFVPTPGLPSNLPSLGTTSHSNPRDQQMETNTPVSPFTTNISNTDQNSNLNQNLAGGDNYNLNHSYNYPNSQQYCNQNYSYSYPNNQQYSNPIYSYNHPNNQQQNNDSPAGGSGTDMVSKLLNDDYGLISADNKVHDDLDWWRSFFQAAGELLNSEAEMDDADWPASRQLERALMHQELLACTMPSFPSTSTQPRQE